MSTVPTLYSRLEEAATTVREYGGSMPSKAFDEYLGELEAVYADALRSVDPEGLKELQACVRQVVALRKLLKGDPSNGRV